MDYLDTSALTKLVVDEPETPALLTWLGTSDDVRVSCDLARTELLRAVRKVIPDLLPQARLVLDSLMLTRLTSDLCEAAARVDPTGLRSLDAIHLAAALDLGDELARFVTYDGRLAEAAARNGLVVVAPS